MAPNISSSLLINVALCLTGFIITSASRECPPSTVELENSCTRFYGKVYLNMESAQKRCREDYDESSFLVSVESQEESDRYKIYSSEETWLGLTRTEEEIRRPVKTCQILVPGTSTDPVWRWSNGKPLEYENWGPGEPSEDAATHGCATFHYASWRSADCDESNRFACKLLKEGEEDELYTTCTHEADPDEMTGIGMNKTLGCYIEIEGLPIDVSYIWYKDGGELVMSKGSKYTGLSTWKIVLHNLGKDDEGVYTCRIKNQVGLGKTNAAYKLSLPGQAKLVGPEGPVISGQNIKMECLPGHPEKVSRLQWYLNGGALGATIKDPKPEDFIHSIQDVHGEDQGQYKCELTSPFGKDDAVFKLDVYCKC